MKIAAARNLRPLASLRAFSCVAFLLARLAFPPFLLCCSRARLSDCLHLAWAQHHATSSHNGRLLKTETTVKSRTGRWSVRDNNLFPFLTWAGTAECGACVPFPSTFSRFPLRQCACHEQHTRRLQGRPCAASVNMRSTLSTAGFGASIAQLAWRKRVSVSARQRV